MNYSNLTKRISGEKADAWNIHIEALNALNQGEDVILLSVGDPDFDSPKATIEATHQALDHGDTHYTPIAGYDELRSAVAKYHGERFDRPLTGANVAICAGTQNALFVSARCLFNPGDEILVPDPAYVTYQPALEADGAKVIPVPSDADHQFQLNVEILEQAITPACKAIVLANPNNPTGMVLGYETLSQLVDIAIRHDLWLVVDEVYMSLVYDEPFHSVLEFKQAADRIVVLGSLSKSHAMTGWRLGWVIGPEELIEHISHLNIIMSYGQPGFIQQGALVTFKHYDELAAPMKEAWKERRDLAVSILSDCPGVTVITPKAGMFLLLDVRQSGYDSNELSWKLFRECGVSVLDASAFGEATKGFLRISFACKAERLKEACQRICRAMNNLCADTETY